MVTMKFHLYSIKLQVATFAQYQVSNGDGDDVVSFVQYQVSKVSTFAEWQALLAPRPRSEVVGGGAHSVRKRPLLQVTTRILRA